MTREANVLEQAIAWLERTHPVDARGRMHARPGTPRFVFVRTPLGCVWRFREDLPPDLVGDLARLAGREPGARDLAAAPPERIEPMRVRLDALPPERIRLVESSESDAGGPLQPGGNGDARPTRAEVYSFPA